MLLVKDKDVVGINDCFIYSDEIYYKFKEGISLYKTTYYKSSKPIKIKKKDYLSKKKGNGYFVRFFTLEFAPLNWLLDNGYKTYNV